MDERFLLLGLILILLGFFLVFISPFVGSKGKSEAKVEIAVGGFIGPIPFGFATSKEALYLLIVIMFISLIFMYLFFFRF